MPEICSSRAVFTVPAEIITSLRARTSRTSRLPRSTMYRTPTARLPSSKIALARALVRTSNPARLRAGCRNIRAALRRQPPSMARWK